MPGLLFGISGLPLGGDRKSGYASGIAHLAGIGLSAMELPFVRSVNVTDRNREAVRRAAAEAGVRLSAHGSYYLNLNAETARKREESLARIIQAAEALKSVGGTDLVFHPGYYLGQPPEKAHAAIRDCLARLPDLGLAYRLETTGKPTQFGTVEEIVALCRELPLCQPCLDFAHIHARAGGGLGDYADFVRVLETVRHGLGPGALESVHAHISGIAYTAKGERSHLPLAESDFNYRDCLRALRDLGVRGRVICESPRLEHDALLLKETFEGAGRG